MNQPTSSHGSGIAEVIDLHGEAIQAATGKALGVTHRTSGWKPGHKDRSAAERMAAMFRANQRKGQLIDRVA
jgi:hypothetical protein